MSPNTVLLSIMWAFQWIVIVLQCNNIYGSSMRWHIRWSTNYHHVAVTVYRKSEWWRNTNCWYFRNKYPANIAVLEVFATASDGVIPIDDIFALKTQSTSRYWKYLQHFFWTTWFAIRAFPCRCARQATWETPYGSITRVTRGSFSGKLRRTSQVTVEKRKRISTRG